MIARAVIGANFGDEGKGLITDYLVDRHESDLVVRINGGAQAGHTVVTADGRRHVFGHVGAGALAGASTLLSRFFIVNPPVFNKEWMTLTSTFPRGLTRKIMVDRRAYVTTPYEMMLNQLVEEKRGAARHGSCGLGIGETVEREEASPFHVRAEDLDFADVLRVKLREIAGYWVPQRLQKLGLDPTAGGDFWASDDVLDNFLAATKYFLQMVRIVDDVAEIAKANDVIFEGAQGLLLDQNHEYFPHVTRSNTGIKNALVLAREAMIKRMDVIYVTRTYLTRHGAGPLPREISVPPFGDPTRVKETNVTNQFQGELRYAYLNVDLLKKTITNDLMTNNTDVKVTPYLAITCIDQQGGDVHVLHDGKLKYLSFDDHDVGDKIARLAGFFGRHLKSFGPSRSNVQDVSPPDDDDAWMTDTKRSPPKRAIPA